MKTTNVYLKNEQVLFTFSR